MTVDRGAAVGRMEETSLVGGDERSLGRKRSARYARRNRSEPVDPSRSTMTADDDAAERPGDHDLAPGPVHGHRRASRRRRLRAGRHRRPLDRRRLGRLAGVLHERRPGRRGPGRRPARARGRSARPSSEPRPTIIGYAGVTFLHQPDGALANDLALREHARPRDPDVPPDAVLATDPEALFYRGRRREPHRPPSRRPRRGRCRLPGRPQPDGVPGARPRRAGRARGPAAVPVLVRRPERPGRHLARRSTASSRPCRAREARSSEPARWPDGSASGRPRRASRSGRWPPRRLRVIVIDEDEDGDEADGPRLNSALRRPRAAAAGPGPSRSTARPGHPRGGPSIATSSPRVRSPAAPARCSSAATVTSANRSRISASVGQWRIRIGSIPA